MNTVLAQVPVYRIALWHDTFGISPAEIAALYPGLSEWDVRRCLSYYRAHQGEIEQQFFSDEACSTAFLARDPFRLQGVLRQH